MGGEPGQTQRLQAGEIAVFDADLSDWDRTSL
jgi:hypothetical protein